LQDGSEGAARPAQQRLDAGDQLRECEWLHEIIIGPSVQAADPILHRVPGGQDEDRNLVSPRSRCDEEGEAIAVGEPQVQNHRIVGHHRERRLAVRTCVYGIDNEASAPQGRRDQLHDAGFVLYQQQTHGTPCDSRSQFAGLLVAEHLKFNAGLRRSQGLDHPGSRTAEHTDV
jgi:hypothetical protein